VSESTRHFTASVVLIGQFNPPIFSPAWMNRVGLVPDEALDDAQVAIIHRDIAQFAVGGFSFDIRRGRFSIEVDSEPLVQALDASLAIFGEHVPHIPVSEFGINYTEHFELDEPARRVALGRRLAPIEPWGEYGAELDALVDDRTSGVVDLVMRLTYDPPESGGLRVEIEPSELIEPLDVGVVMLVNDHRRITDTKEADGARPALTLLSEIFDESLSRSRKIVSDMHDFAKGLKL